MHLTHVTIATVGRLALARDETERRTLVRALASVATRRLLGFGFADDHLHFSARARHPRHLARDVRRRVAAALPSVQLQTPHLQPIESRAHLERVVTYQLRQTAKHDVASTASAALWTGSCFLDLVGARLLPGFDASLLQAELPRLRARLLFGAVGLAPVPLEPASNDTLRRAGAARLVTLAAAVYAVGPALVGRGRLVVAARALAVQVANRCGLPASEVRLLLGVNQSTTWRLTQRPTDPRAARALRLRLTLEQRVAASWSIA
jgi:hypothetical protein